MRTIDPPFFLSPLSPELHLHTPITPSIPVGATIIIILSPLERGRRGGRRRREEGGTRGVMEKEEKKSSKACHQPLLVV